MIDSAPHAGYFNGMLRFSLLLASFVSFSLFVSGCAAYRYFGPPSDHFNGKQFFNEAPVPEARRNVIGWLLTREPPEWPDWIENAELSQFPKPRVDSGNALEITFINHSTFLIQTAGVNILTDPVWSYRVGPFAWLGPRRHRDPGLPFDKLPKIDIVILSHDHYDHTDIPTLKKLIQRDQPQIFYGLGVDQQLMLERLDHQGTRFDWWESRKVGPKAEVTIHFTPAQHFSNRGILDRNATLWGSWVIEAPGGPVYFAGDTGLGSHFRKIREKFGPMRVAMLPIGAYLPRDFMSYVHVDPAEAVEAHRILESRFSVGMHFGTFQQSDEAYDAPEKDLARALKARSLSPRSFVAPGFGQVFTFY